jgi:ATP-dependent helicase/nuclease subunit A
MIPVKPKNVRWTDDQWRGIHKRGGNILVSAGAGSGKTAVLTKRVVELVKSGTDVSNLLVVTFTRAAALEMKSRIRDDLQKLLIEGDESIAHQLELLESANITTFDGYSLFIVKKYSDILHVSRELSVGDPVILKQAKHSIVEGLFESYYEKKDKAFFNYLRRYSTKTDTGVAQSIIDLGDKLMKDPNFEEYLNGRYNDFFTEEYYHNITQQAGTLLDEQITYLKYFVARLYRSFPGLEQTEYIAKIEESLLPLFDHTGFDDVYHFILKYKIPTKPRSIFDDNETIEFASIRKFIKQALVDIKDIARCPMNEYVQDVRDNEEYIVTLVSIVREYISRYHAYQKDNNIYDYQTIAYLSIQLIQNNPEIQEELKQLYTEIMVDEYQDTNLLQDQFVSLISNNNLYLVGDIKQSIYRFRDATPSLFQKKYVEYSHNETDTVIHLNKNFRSRSEVLEDINDLFTRTFDRNIGGIEYDEKQQLEFGLTPYNKERIDTQNYGLEILTYFEEEIEEYDDGMSKKSKSMGCVEIEAITIAKDIFSKVQNKHQIFDKEDNCLRDATYDDFVILIDRKTNFELFQQKFKECGVPLYIHKENEFISNMDVVVTFNLLKLVQSLKNSYYTKKYFKHSFLSVAFSHLFDFNKSDIIHFMYHIPSFNPKDIMEYSVNTPFEDMINSVYELSSKIDAMQIDEIVFDVMKKFKTIEKTIGLGTIQSAEERQLYLLTKATELKGHQYDLEQLIKYFDYIIYQQGKGSLFGTTDIEFVKGTSLAQNKVNIMTIHKSKGLEFPVVYFPQLHPGWKSSSFDAIQYSKEYGIVIPTFREGLRITVPKVLNKYHIQREDLSERMRVLYVALTRARESMIFVTKSSKNEEILPSLPSEKIINEAVRRGYKSYHNVLASVSLKFNSKIQELDIDEEYFESTVKSIYEKDLLVQNSAVSTFTYINNRGNTDSITDETYSLKSSSILSRNDLYMIKVGNYIHQTLEGIDFNSLHTLDLNQGKRMYRDELSAFLHSQIIQDNLDGRFYKEFEFATQNNTTIKRGVIDLMIEKEDEIIIIDYKLKDISKKHYVEQVKGYASFMEEKTGKTVKGYLYSLLDKKFKQVV